MRDIKRLQDLAIDRLSNGAQSDADIFNFEAYPTGAANPLRFHTKSNDGVKKRSLAKKILSVLAIAWPDGDGAIDVRATRGVITDIRNAPTTQATR